MCPCNACMSGTGPLKCNKVKKWVGPIDMWKKSINNLFTMYQFPREYQILYT